METVTSKWQKKRLGEVVEIVKDGWFPNNEKTKYIGLEHINQGDLSLNGIGVSDKLGSNKFRFSTGDILFGKLRPYFRKVVKVDFNGVCSTDIWVIRAKEGYDQSFLFYFMANPVLIAQSMGTSTGTHMPRADWGYLAKTEWDFPIYKEQEAIGVVLSSLDNKIKLLRKQNETLEQIARTLFHEWFVEFNFPNEKGQPYKASGGKMIESELGEIPEGWEVSTLGQEFQIVMGQSPTGDTFNTVGEGVVFYQGRTDFGSRFPKVRLYTTEPTRLAELFDVLVSVRAPVGDMNVAGEKCCIGRGLAAVRGEYKSYTLYKLFSVQDAIKAFDSEGTVFGSVNKADLGNISVIVPPDHIAKLFDRTIQPLDNKITNGYSECAELEIIRDTLLPKLMNGEVRIR